MTRDRALVFARGRHAAFTLALAFAGLYACGDDDDVAEEMQHEDGGRHEHDAAVADRDAAAAPEPDAAVAHDAGEPEPEPDAGIIVDAGHDAGELPEPPEDAGPPPPPPLSLGGLTVNMSRDEQSLDLFGTFGHRFWIQVSPEQLALINDQASNFDPNGDIYTPGDEVEATYADHVLVQDAVTQSVADYGQVEVKLVGQSTYRSWSRTRIPNVKLDSDELEAKKKIGGFEHIRLNNSLVGSIFREHLAHEIYRALGYPALRSGYAFLGSNVWGDDVWVPMTLIEVYKRKFCEDNQEQLGGTCNNMWEFVGDLGPGGGGVGPGPDPIPIDIAPVPIPRPGDGGGQTGVPDSWCQLHECDNTRLEAAMSAVTDAPNGTGFEAALEPYVDWAMFHQFQCLSWIMWTGDDPIHGGNNNLVIERDDGRLVWAPYSVDISAGQDWATNVSLLGSSSLASCCQREPGCWAETIASCEDLIARFGELQPETMVDDLVAKLDELGMLRDGDQERAEFLRAWFVWREEGLADELERFRYLPDAEGACPDTMMVCEDQTCGTQAQCDARRCTLGQDFCTSLGRCVQPEYEECPACDEEGKPFYCGASEDCVAGEPDCAAVCEQMPDQEYCQDQHDCVPLGTCGGVIID